MTGIGPRIKQERIRLKLTQSALGTIGGVAVNAQGKYESGTRAPKADYLSRIAEAGVDIHFVLTGERIREVNSSTATPPIPENQTLYRHVGKVTDRLHRHFHEFIDALHQMTVLVETRANGNEDQTTKTELEIIRQQAQALTQATVRLIFVTSKPG